MDSAKEINETPKTRFEAALSDLMHTMHYMPDQNGFMPRTYFLTLSGKFCNLSEAAMEIGFQTAALEALCESAHYLEKIDGYAKGRPSRGDNLAVSSAGLSRTAEKCAQTILAFAQIFDKDERLEAERRQIFHAINDLAEIKLNAETEKNLAAVWSKCGSQTIGEGEDSERIKGLAKIIFSVDVAGHSSKNRAIREAAAEILERFKPDEVDRARQMARASLDAVRDAVRDMALV